MVKAQEPEQESVAEVKRGTLRIVIEDKLLPELINGAIWDKPEEMSDEDFFALISGKIETLKKFKGLITTGFQRFDKELTDRRNIQGSDFLEGLEHFRKPRESKGSDNSSLLEELDY